MISYLKNPILTGAFLMFYLSMFGQNLTNNTNIEITKSWSQEASGWTYPIYIDVPSEPMPSHGYPVCILLHGNGGNGPGMINMFRNTLNCHILVSVSGYLSSWNIIDEASDAPDVEMVSDLIDSLQGYDNVNPDKIRVLGSSNGSALTNRVFIENNYSGVDIFCAIVSHLSEELYRNNSFYYPSGSTDGSLNYGGYDTPKTPIAGRKYLNISNENDGLIPYYGGSSVVGANFLDAQDAAFAIAQSQGYSGAQITGNGNQIGNSTVYEYAYLDKHIVHLRSDANHGINDAHRDYIADFFNDCEDNTAIKKEEEARFNLFPNPTRNRVVITLNHTKNMPYSVINLQGQIVKQGIIERSKALIDMKDLESGLYFINIDNHYNPCYKL